MSRATRHADGTLRWVVEGRLGDNEYALTRRAGFKWHKGKKAWVAPHTPEREAFLLERVSHIERLDVTPYAQQQQMEANLPELVDFRLTRDKKTAIFFIREGENFYRKHLDLTKEGAGLYAVNHKRGLVTLRRFMKQISHDAVDGAVFDRHLSRKFIVATASSDMVRALTFVFWGKEDTCNSPETEGVQPASAELLSNAAD